MYRHYVRFSLVLAACLLVSAPAYAVPPNTNAGPDQSVNEQTQVQLNGSATDPDGGAIVTYAWTQTGGPNVTLSNTGIANPTFTAPVRTVAQGSVVLTFQLTATDDQAEFSSDTVNITVNPVNSNPNADAGPNQNVNEQTNVNLNGTGSSDADGPIAAYAWVQQQGTAVALAGANTATPSFTAPSRTEQQGSETLRFQLTVTDSDGVTDSDSVDITVNPANADPVANAGPDQTVNENSPVSLNGTASSDPDGTIASYAWTQTAGTGVSLNGANTATPSFTSPDLPGNSGATLTFQLQVTDNEGATDTDSVDIDIDQVNQPPVVQTPIPDQAATEDQAFSLNISSNFSDPDTDTLTYSATGLPASLAPINANTGVINGTPTQAEAEANGGVYSVTVTARDPSNAQVSDTFTLTVAPDNDAPVATPQNVATDEDTSVAITLTGTDPDSPTLTFAIATPAVERYVDRYATERDLHAGPGLLGQ